MNQPTVLITGALTGIGRATAFAFAKLGANVVVSGRNVKRDFVKPGTADKTLPFAFAQASDITTTSGTTSTFTVTFNDTSLVKAVTVGAGDIQVTGPNGFVQTATFVSKSPAQDAVSIIATYRITSPGGTWDAPDNGLYSIKLLPKKVTDKAGNAAVAATVGTFTANLT